MPCRAATSTVFPSPFLLSCANRNGDAFETRVISHIVYDSHLSYGKVSSRSVKVGRTGQIPPRGTLHISSRKDKHRAYRREYHIRLYKNGVEYCESNIDSARSCRVTGVRYSNTDSAMPYFVTVYSAYLKFRSTARISFPDGNPWNLGCVLYRTEIAVILTVPHTVLLPQTENGILVTRKPDARLSLFQFLLLFSSASTAALANCFTILASGGDRIWRHRHPQPLRIFCNIVSRPAFTKHHFRTGLFPSVSLFIWTPPS